VNNAVLTHCYSVENAALQRRDEEDPKEQEEDTEEDEEFTETYDYIEEIACLERKTSSRSTPQVIEPSDDEGEMEEEEAETKELDGTISVKSADEEGSRVKKFIVSYETKVLKSPSPALSHGNYRFYVCIDLYQHNISSAVKSKYYIVYFLFYIWIIKYSVML